jgi:hypothetical protein
MGVGHVRAAAARGRSDQAPLLSGQSIKLVACARELEFERRD